ncbi:hypothetical protein L1987_48137 [Smallanthus sonchifolius]|uniref:Uncharacterized protein n=1 Tax=Smallanthus sonchifolius TaxID=185202 RepID=A0ACB9FSR6_9ASTR|nr:hypothetical protein L1987_48137 [Smallanthus sonchifolius]
MKSYAAAVSGNQGNTTNYDKGQNVHEDRSQRKLFKREDNTEASCSDLEDSSDMESETGSEALNHAKQP